MISARRVFRTRLAAPACLLVLSFGASVGRGQPITFEPGTPATWLWEASTDLGATWLSGVVPVSRPDESVLVRARVFFPPEAGRYVRGAALDVIVAGWNGAGRSDTITNVFRGELFNVPVAGVFRFGNILKIDDALDSLPPGVGSSWYVIAQDPPTLTRPNQHNPLHVMQFTLHLDGSLGDREVSQVWAPLSIFYQDNIIITTTVSNYLASTIHPLEVDPLVIHVVPCTPALLPICIGAAMFAMRRRHPNVPPHQSRSWGSQPT